MKDLVSLISLMVGKKVAFNSPKIILILRRLRAYWYFKLNINESEFQLDLGGLAKGMYLLSLKKHDGTKSTQKIFKQ